MMPKELVGAVAILRRLLTVPRTVAQLRKLTGWSTYVITNHLANIGAKVSIIVGPCDRPAKGYCLP